MKNPRITTKERNLIKGALRRVFSRSELRRSIIDASIIIGFTDDTRPRVKTWCKCAECGKPTPKSYAVVDHLSPVVKLDSSLEEMSWNELVDNIWCEASNLQVLDEECHLLKSKQENKIRRANKKARQALLAPISYKKVNKKKGPSKK